MKSFLLFSLMVYVSYGAAQECLQDPEFGTNGRSIVSVSNTQILFGGKIAVQQDGNIVQVGTIRNSTTYAGDVFVLRYKKNGNLDSSFGTKGLVITDVSTGSDDYASAIALQPGGGIIVAGNYYSYGSISFVLRYKTDGTLDSSFGTNGRVKLTAGGALNNLQSLSIQEDGRIIVAGGIYDYPNLSSIRVVRLNSNGTVDPSFGENGKINKHLGHYITTVDGQAINGFADEYATTLAIQPDRKIIIGTVSYDHQCSMQPDYYGGTYLYCDPVFAMTRVHENGSTDSAFGKNGTATDTSLFSGTSQVALTLQPDGKIVVTGNSRYGGFSVERFNSNGTLDNSFGTGGKTFTKVGGPLYSSFPNSLQVLPGGKIAVAGTFSIFNAPAFAIVRYTENGMPDPTFANQGEALLSLKSAFPSSASWVSDQPLDIALQENKIVLSGSASAQFSNYQSYLIGLIRLRDSVTIIPTAITYNGSTNLCLGDSLRLTTNAVGSYQWKKDNVAIAGATSASYTVRTGGNYSLSVTNNNGCGESRPLEVRFHPMGDPPFISFVSGAVICQGKAVVLNTGEYDTLQWYKDGVAISGANQSSYSAVTPGTYTVYGEKASYCGVRSAPVVVTASDNPLTPLVDSTGPLTFCAGNNSTLSCSSTETLQWYRDGYAITGATGNRYTPTSSGIYYVTATNVGGCSVSSSPLSITAIKTDKPNIARSGSDLTISESYSNYQWFLNNQAIAGATLSTYAPAKCGSYSVAVTNTSCTVTSDPFTVNSLDSPKPVVDWNNGTLQTSGNYISYQWYLENTPVAGATSATYQPASVGIFRVAVNDNNACTLTSEPFNLRLAVSTLSVGDVKLSVFPNPARNSLFIDVANEPGTSTISIELYDAHSRMIMKRSLKRGLNQLEVLRLPSGVYPLVVTNGSARTMVKVVIAK